MHDAEMMEIINQEFKKRGHFSATPDGKLTPFAEIAFFAMRLAEARGYQRGMAEAAKHMR